MHDDELATLCASWPGVTADIKWDHDRVYSVGGKMFCVLALDPAKRGQLSVKVDPERFLELTDQPGIHPAPYLARAHWVSLSPGHPLPGGQVHALIRGSYERVFASLTKKLQREIAGGGQGA